MTGISKVAITIGFMISGAAGLTYEVLWQRKLALIFGSTLPAVTVVLAAFMGGLAAGSFIFGRLADRSGHPIRLCGFLELGVAVYCLLMPVIFDLIETLHLVFFSIYGDGLVIEIIRLIFSFAILILPCSFMGGTLPVLSRAIIRSTSELGTRIALLYFLNTLGAVAGTVFAGFVSIRLWGSAATNTIAVGLNLITAVLFLSISVMNPAGTRDVMQHVKPRERNWIPWVYGLLGFLAMACEVAWTRSLNLVIGSTVYAFTIMLASFLIGIALGSLAAGRWIDTVPSPLAAMGFLVSLTGLLTAVSIAVISRLPVLMVMLFPRFHERFFIWQSCLFGMGILVVFPATFSMGATFPAVSKAYIHVMRSIGRNVGNLYLWNTLGGIAGSALAGFILIPLMGTRMTLLLAAVSFILTGLGILWFRGDRNYPRSRIAALCILCIVLTALLPDWNPVLLDSGVYVYAPQLVDGFEKNRKLVYQNEGMHSYVTVSDLGGVRSLRINGKTDGSDGGDLITQILLAQLPLMHIDNPTNTLIIGLGTGVTLGSALSHPHLRAVCVEIDGSVIEASRYFDHVSGRPLDSPRAEIIAADARSVLAASNTVYDVIISEPSNPWITGVSNLFTLEHFQACFDAMAPGGIMCQWIHSYYMETETLLILMRSFGRIFPYCSLWEGSSGDYLILGSSRPLEFSSRRMTELLRHREIKRDLMRIDIHNPEDLLKRHLLDSDHFNRLIGQTGDALNTDDKPVVEFNAPRSLYRDTTAMNRAVIDRYR
ncbi:fused MFS/spermidine synthase [bacterium]|nr:fused MFS/spermidine synthase [candidate division CSSED10-310 bacterium]